MKRASLCFLIFFLIVSFVYPYGREFSFRIKIKNPPEVKTDKFQVGMTYTQISISIQENVWSEWIKVTQKDIENIKKVYPNSYFGRYPLVMKIVINPGFPDQEIFLEYDVDKEVYSSKALCFKPGPMVVGVLQWEEDGILTMGTMAEYNRKYWQEIKKAEREIGKVERPKKLVIVDRFIGSDGDFYAWKEGFENLAKIGFNALLIDNPDKNLRELLLKTGIKKAAYAVYCPPGYVFDFDEKSTSETAIKNWAKDIATKYIEAGFNVEDIAHFALCDEPGWYFPSVFKYLEDPENLERFYSYFKSKGLNPQNLGFSNWEEWYSKVKPLGRSVAKVDLPSRKVFYWTCRFFPDISYKYFARITKALEEAFYPKIPITVNWNFFAGRFYFPGPFGNNPDRKSPDAAMGSHDWLEFGRARGSTCLWTEDWFSDDLSFQWSFYASKLKSAARKSNVEFGGYVIGRTTGEGATQRVVTLFGHGAKVIKFYVFGPEYNFPGNCWSENPKCIKGIMRGIRMAAKAEELLYPGRPVISQVAILTPQSSLVWDQKEMEVASGIVDATNVLQNHATTTYMAEVYNIYLALMHSNIQVDFVDEDDLLDEKLMSSYKVLFITAPNLPLECVKALQKWIDSGGILATTYGACTADRYDTPSNLLYSSYGIELKEPSHPRIIIYYNLWKDSTKDTVSFSSDSFKAAWAKGEIVSYRERSEVIANFSDGTPAIIFTPSGKGGILHYAFYPGCSYFISGVLSNKHGFYNLPYGFSSLIREVILLGIKKAGVKPYVNVSEPMIEAVPLVSEKGIAVTVLNWSGVFKEKIKLEIECNEKISAVESVTSGKIPFVQEKNTILCEIPLKDADILLLKK